MGQKNFTVKRIESEINNDAEAHVSLAKTLATNGNDIYFGISSQLAPFNNTNKSLSLGRSNALFACQFYNELSRRENGNVERKENYVFYQASDQLKLKSSGRRKSISALKCDNQNDFDKGLTDHVINELEHMAIQLSYKFIKDNLNAVGIIAFMKSFETLPELKASFDSFKNLPIDELSQSHALRTHSQKVMRVIDDFVKALETNKLEEMKEKLFQLGQRHNIYRVKKEHFFIIELQFVRAIKPIITTNLYEIKKRTLIEKDVLFSILFDEKENFDDFRLNTDDNENDSDDDYLNANEVDRALEFIENTWHKLFEIIRFHMNRGILSIEQKHKIT